MRLAPDFPSMHAAYAGGWQVRQSHVLVGPVSGPGVAPCTACCRARLASNGHSDPRPLDPGCHAGRVAEGMCLLERLGNPPGILLEWADGQWTSHLVLPLPYCGCRGAALRQPVSDLRAARSALVGIVADVSSWQVPGLAAGGTMAVASACRLRALGGLASIIDGAAFGDAACAHDAAIGEVLERYCASFMPPDLPLCTVRELGEEHLLPASGPFGGAALGIDDPLRWVRGQRLIDGSPCWVQASAVYFPYVCHDREPRRSRGGSEGLGAASSWHAAVEHAAHERIERDAFIRAWRYNGRRWKLANPYPQRGDLRFTLVGNRFGLPVVTAFAEHTEKPYATAGIAARASIGAAIEASAREALGAQALYRIFKENQDHSIEARYWHAVDPALRGERDAWTEVVAHDAGAGQDELPWNELVRRLPDAVAVNVTTDDVSRLGVHVARVVIPGCHGFEPVCGRSQLGGNPAPPPF
jgi:ribosomal protein S12 methylthiotransferase accessory factor YcaO